MHDDQQCVFSGVNTVLLHLVKQDKLTQICKAALFFVFQTRVQFHQQFVLVIAITGLFQVTQLSLFTGMFRRNHMDSFNMFTISLHSS